MSTSAYSHFEAILEVFERIAPHIQKGAVTAVGSFALFIMHPPSSPEEFALMIETIAPKDLDLVFTSDSPKDFADLQRDIYRTSWSQTDSNFICKGIPVTNCGIPEMDRFLGVTAVFHDLGDKVKLLTPIVSLFSEDVSSTTQAEIHASDTLLFMKQIVGDVGIDIRIEAGYKAPLWGSAFYKFGDMNYGTLRRDESPSEACAKRRVKSLFMRFHEKKPFKAFTMSPVTTLKSMLGKVGKVDVGAVEGMFKAFVKKSADDFKCLPFWRDRETSEVPILTKISKELGVEAPQGLVDVPPGFEKVPSEALPENTGLDYVVFRPNRMGGRMYMRDIVEASKHSKRFTLSYIDDFGKIKEWNYNQFVNKLAES